jgi:hypothetical protein
MNSGTRNIEHDRVETGGSVRVEHRLAQRSSPMVTRVGHYQVQARGGEIGGRLISPQVVEGQTWRTKTKAQQRRRYGIVAATGNRE